MFRNKSSKWNSLGRVKKPRKESQRKPKERQLAFLFSIFCLPFYFSFFVPIFIKGPSFWPKVCPRGVRTGQAQDFHGKKVFSFLLLYAFVIWNFSLECKMVSSIINLEKNFQMVFKLTGFLAQDLKMTNCKKIQVNKEPKLPIILIMLLSDQDLTSNFKSKALATFYNETSKHSE